MIRVVLATGITALDEQIVSMISDIENVGNALYREAVVSVIQRKNPHVVVLSDSLEGTMKMRELVLNIRTLCPETRIILLMKHDDPKERSFYYHFHIFDILYERFTSKMLEDAFFRPKSFKDISKELDELKAFVRPEEWAPIDVDSNEFSTINANDYEKMDAPASAVSELYQQIAAFWSVRDGAGKTFSIINTALLLASKPDLKILMLDFNLENPSFNIQFKVNDPDRNLGAMIEDVESGSVITKDTLNQYITPHPLYKNLHIVLGSILHTQERSPEFIVTVYDQIIQAAQQNNYTTILVDMDSGIRNVLSAHILSSATRIMLHVDQDLNHFNAAKTCFDPEIGRFTTNLIDRKKVFIILNKASDTQYYAFKNNLEATLNLRIQSIILRRDDIFQSMVSAEPILSKKNRPQDIYDTFIHIANLIHKKLFVAPVRKKNATLLGNKKDEKKKFASSLFSKNKK